MTPLFILLVTFIILLAADRFIPGGKIGKGLAGRASMSVMLLATGIAHFTSTDLMVEMMPNALPLKRELVYFTGLCELAAAAALLWQRTAVHASVTLIIFFVAILPANVAGSLKSVQLGGMENGPWYLLFRIPLQIFFIIWVYYFGIRLMSEKRVGESGMEKGKSEAQK